MPSVLIVDDLSAIHEMLAAVIQPTGYEMAFASDGEEALEQYKAEAQDVVLADISMQPMDGITLLQQLKTFDPECVVIMMTGYASTETAVKALKYGAFDYIQKPFKIDELIQTLKRAVEFRSRSRGKRSEIEEAAPGVVELADRFVGQSRKIQRIRQQATKLMAGSSPLLIQGERGVGKRTIAELVHEGSLDKEGPFIVIDCALNEDAAFRAGLVGEGNGGDWVNRAKGGTLFLQHVECIPLPYQRALVGVIKGVMNETRIVSSTHLDLESLVDEGRFDDELFYRIAALPVQIPPLRDHLDDLPGLVKHFIKEAKNPGFEGSQIEFTPEALTAMSRYPWPGNVAELRQVVINLASTTEERLIDAARLPLKVSALDEWPSLADHLAKEEASYIRRVLRVCGGDKEKAASVLGCEAEKVDQALAEQAVL